MSNAALQQKLGSVVYRKPSLGDAKDIHGLIRSCHPLDLNSRYAYMLLCSHFAETCVVARHGTDIVGFLSAYCKPAAPDVLFVWQVAVHSTMRGQGVGRRLLTELVSRPYCSNVQTIETTIGPTNQGSWALFDSFAATLGAPSARATIFHEEDFGDEGHEEEQLLRIGPFDPELRGILCKSLNS